MRVDIFRKSILAAVILLAAAANSVMAQEDKDSLSPEQMAALAESVSAKMVVVEYYMKHDKGSEPFVDVSAMASGGRYSRELMMLGDYSPDACITNERPFEAAGMPVSATEIITPDLMIHPRFIKSIKVRFAGKSVPAKIESICSDRPAVIIKLSEPLEGLEPLSFSPASEKDLFAVTTRYDDGTWKHGIAAMPKSVGYIVGQGPRRASPPPGSVIVDADGAAITLSYTKSLPMDDSWKVSPRQWPFMSVARVNELADSVRKVFDSSLALVRLSLRSPKQDQSGSRRYSDSEDDETEKYCIGAILDDGRIMVVEDLAPKVTARLEGITVIPAGDAEPVKAEFVCSLKDYGAFIARMPQGIGEAVRPWDGKLADMLGDMLMSVEVKLQGERLDIHMLHRRFVSIGKGFQGNLSPELGTPDADVLLYDLDGRLLGLPSMKRSRDEDNYSRRYRSRSESMMAVAEIASFIYGDLTEYIEPDNVPLSEEQELRLAWLGIELQPLDKELARINKVSSHTDDGDYGCLVSYVYKNSPAAEAGLKLGDVLIQMHSEKWPTPKKVTLEDFIDPRYFMQMWEHLDEIPEEAFSQFPTPWPSAENTVTRALTDLGFGQKFTLEFARAGEIQKHDFEVTQCPSHYHMAKKYKSDSLGLTVRDLTFEVRRYFQRREDDPGIIVSKIEPGLGASKAKLRTYEIITHINNEPVMNVGDFERLAAQGELTLQVKRMTKGRVVLINATADQEASEPAAETPAEEAPATTE